eukprot:scaffold18662_cov101-Skeletonema_dohrnii-CCMP3373.AAC.4
MDTSPHTFASSHRFNKATIVVIIFAADCWWRATQIDLALWSAELEEEHDSKWMKSKGQNAVFTVDRRNYHSKCNGLSLTS